MTKFQIIMWYVGVLVVSLTLLLSFLTSNWILAGMCAILAYVLRLKSNDVAIPKVYRDKGISNTHFFGKRNKDKNSSSQ